MKHYSFIALTIWLAIAVTAFLSRNDILMAGGSQSSTIIYRVPFGIVCTCLLVLLAVSLLVTIPSISKYAVCFTIAVFLLTLISMQSMQIEERNGKFIVQQKTGLFTLQKIGQVNESDLLTMQKKLTLVMISNGNGQKIFIPQVPLLNLDKQFYVHPVFKIQD